EQAILSGLRARAERGIGRNSGLRVGIGDDAAVLAVRRGEEIVVTTDFSLEDVHFRRGWHAPEAVGHKCLARGLSDIAAMGARPVAAFLSLAVPQELARGRSGTRSWIDHFYDGLLALAGRWDVPIAGGDLAQAPGGKNARVAADIVVVGAVERGRALLRSGARAGDALYVTGTLGGAAAELRALMRSNKRTPAQPPARYRSVIRSVILDTPEHPHFFPQPRISIGRALVRRRLAAAAIDISDGLSVDLQHLCEESGLRAEVDAALLPLGAGATLRDALHGGDDYELLFTADASARVPRSIAGVPVRRVGRMLRRKSGQPQMIVVQDGRRSELRAEGWQHF
ncbi:MAG TPA: thiamine-phosphate kinase, partial [Acidobacteriaceae bacterium]|nr:thiamine-phosphate kinase [Acidobacteriaceae bacterium]